MKIRRLFTLISGAGLFIAVCAGGAADPMTKSQSFDHDPSWDAHNNRLVPAKLPTVVQDFGYSPTNVAGKGPGEWYADSESLRYSFFDKIEDDEDDE